MTTWCGMQKIFRNKRNSLVPQQHIHYEGQYWQNFNLLRVTALLYYLNNGNILRHLMSLQLNKFKPDELENLYT